MLARLSTPATVGNTTRVRMSAKPQILATRRVAESRLFTIDGVDLRLRDGATACFERLSPRSRGGSRGRRDG